MPGVDRPTPGRHNRTMKIRKAEQRGFALVQSLAAGCLLLWAGTALMPAGMGALVVVEPAEPEQPAPQADDTVREVVVTLTSGREITGFLVSENDEQVVIRINGIDTTLPRNRVAGVRELAPVSERYRELRGMVDDNDIRARLALVEWLRARRAYRLAQSELESILERDPGNPDAETLLNWVRNHLALAEREPRQQARERRAPAAPSIPTLSDADINRIRVYEIDLRTPTRVIVPDDVIRELMVRFPDTFPVSVEERDAILKSDPMDKLRLLFDRKARDLYDRVRILEDPPAMSGFKNRVHAGSGGWLMNACASNRCHGGSEAGRLQLLTQRPNSDQTAYTNFFILDNFRLADGTPLINHEEPARSPLLHMALPRRASLYPHPEVNRQVRGQDWRFVFRNTSDRGFQQTVEWITSLYRPRPDYGIVYPPAQPESSVERSAQPDPGP